MMWTETQLINELKSLWQRGQSSCCEVRESSIHGRGVYATQQIAKGTKIIEYVGEKITKDESQIRGNALQNSSGLVYLFDLNEEFDLDGDLPWNSARLINHSCQPNCEAWIEGEQIFIYSTKRILKNQELTFDYGFDISHFPEHVCHCGQSNCVGYIVSREQWP